MGLNLSPYSNINYELNESKQVDSIGEVVSGYSGTGGTYKMVLGSADQVQRFFCRP